MAAAPIRLMKPNPVYPGRQVVMKPMPPAMALHYQRNSRWIHLILQGRCSVVKMPLRLVTKRPFCS